MAFKNQKKGDNGRADQDRTTITVSWKTKRELKALGISGESEETIIKRLMFKKKTGQDEDESATEKKIKELV